MDRHGSRIASPIFFGVLIIMAAAVMLTVYHCVVMTWFNPRRSAHRLLQRRRTEPGPTSSMETSIVRLVPPACIYGKDEGLVAGDESTCAVCLSEFKDGEAVRVMPECSHCFHVPCIDMWLRSHVSCPMCRSVAAPPYYQLHRGGELPTDPPADAAGFDRLTVQ